MLHLQRTKWPLGKLKDHITFPLDALDMKPYSTAEAAEKVGGDGIYELVGVVNHHGQSMDKGTLLLVGGVDFVFCFVTVTVLWFHFNLTLIAIVLQPQQGTTRRFAETRTVQHGSFTTTKR